MSTRRRGTLLVVEKEASIRSLTARVLREEGCDGLEDGDGLEALAVREGRKDMIDLLLTDVVMPGLGGPELAVLFMTGDARESLAQRGLSIDEADCLHEPFRPHELRERLQLRLRALGENASSRTLSD